MLPTNSECTTSCWFRHECDPFRFHHEFQRKRVLVKQMLQIAEQGIGRGWTQNTRIQSVISESVRARPRSLHLRIMLMTDTDSSEKSVDGTAGVRMATEHLIERGHTRIACLAWPEPSLTGRCRLSGYLETMNAQGISVSPDWILRGENTYADAHSATGRLLALPQGTRPSAIVALTDLMAIGAINAAWDAGLEVGRDLAIVGFDDATVTRFLRPTLSSVRQPIAEVGEQLVAKLVKLCQGKPVVPQQVLLNPQLIVRESSMRPHHE